MFKKGSRDAPARYDRPKKRKFAGNRHTFEQDKSFTSASATKLRQNKHFEVTVEQTVLYCILNFVSVFSTISSAVICKECKSTVTFHQRDIRGLGFKISMACKCEKEKEIDSCPKIWTFAPKHLHSGPKVVEIATFLAVIIFNAEFEAILKTLETMGVKIGPQAKGYVQQRDSFRIDRSERRTSDVVKQARIAKREDRAALRDFQKEEEGLLYGPGIAD
ncbi:uncharacterized protein LOC124414663 [Diprion similis]|uniref:uncharacterized protein LOC124414663 n=1 Tax=Diprion similis TaxID=362088 RepID=UPI001EF7BE2D|nr:uncharacterized protein LOC124414663 [Diprion similis]XP_046751640.1 uncharacterized protein LOC124414663 [Diprion similis]